MPFNMLISTCLSDCAVNKEQGVKVYINRKRGERVLFFSIDNADFREFVYGSPNGNVCDVLVYYRGVDTKNGIFCFTELKKELDSVTLPKAVKQLIKAKEGFENKLKEKPRCSNPARQCIGKYESAKLFPKVTWLAYICYKNMPTPLPLDIKTQKAKLKEVFADCRIKDEKDIGKFLRDISRQNNSKN